MKKSFCRDIKKCFVCLWEFKESVKQYCCMRTFTHLFVFCCSLQLSQLSCWLLSRLLSHHRAAISHRKLETLTAATLTNREPTMVHHRSSNRAEEQHQEANMDLQLNQPHATLLNSSQEPTMAHPHNSNHHQLLMAFHPVKISAALTANVQTATSKLHQTSTAFLLRPLHSVHQATQADHQQAATPTTVNTKSQQNTNSNMMFKTNKLVSISVTRNSAREALQLANTTCCSLMAASR